jgi:hypothetical protein
MQAFQAGLFRVRRTRIVNRAKNKKGIKHGGVTVDNPQAHVSRVKKQYGVSPEYVNEKYSSSDETAGGHRSVGAVVELCDCMPDCPFIQIAMIRVGSSTAFGASTAYYKPYTRQ